MPRHRLIPATVTRCLLAVASILSMAVVVASPPKADAAALSTASQLIHKDLRTYNQYGIAADDNNVWVTAFYNSKVYVYKKTDRSLVATITVSGSPQAVMLDGTYAWVSNASGGITQINQSTYQIVKTITWTTSATLPGDTAGMAQEGNHLWVALPSCCQFSNGSIIELDKTTGTVIRSVQVGRYPSSIAIDANSVWVTNGGDDTLSQVDIATGTLVKTFYPASPSYITFSIRSRIGILADDGSHVWLLGEQGKIAMLNASDGSLVKIFDATYGGKSEYFLSSVTTDSKYVWVCGMETVFQIDKSTGTIVGAVTVPNPAYSMASDNSSVWLGTDPYFSQIGIDLPTTPATNTVAPVMSDTTSPARYLVGDSLSTTSGTWSDVVGSYSYQWYRCSSNSVTDPTTSSSCTAISSATSSTYTLVNADVGKYVVPVVTARGSDTVPVPVAAAFGTVVLAPGPAVNTSAPVLSDVTGSGYDVGDTISLDMGTWSNVGPGPGSMSFFACSNNTETNPATSSNCTQLVSPYGNSYQLTSSEKNKYIIGSVTRTGTNSSTTTALSNWSLKVGALATVSCSNNFVVCNMSLSFTDSTHGTLNWSGPKGFQPGFITGYRVTMSQQGSPQILCTITSAATTKCDFAITGAQISQSQFYVYPMAGSNPMSPGMLTSALPIPYGVGGTVGATGLALGWNGSPGTNAVVIDYTVNGKNCIENWSQGNVASGISFSGDCSSWTIGSQKEWAAQAESGWLAPNHTYNVTGTVSQTLSTSSTDLNGFPQAPSSQTVTDSFAFTIKTLATAAPRPSNVSFVDNGDNTYTVSWTNPSGTLPDYAGVTGYNADGQAVSYCSVRTVSAGTNSCTTSAPFAPNGVDPSQVPTSFAANLTWNKTSTNLLSITQGQPQQYSGISGTYITGVVGLNAMSWQDDAGNGSSVTLVTTPNTPTGVTATPGNQQITVTWTASSGSNAPTSYTVSVPGQTDCTIDLVANPSATLSCTFTGLTNGTSYTATVVANNDNGSSSGATASATPRTTPGAPTNVTATAGNGSATVSWTAPASNGGSAISSYTVTASPGGATCTVNAPATTCTVSGLTNGTAYTFSVKATNAAGNSNASSPSTSATPQATAPSAPTNVKATGDDGVATITWTAPTSDGGSPIDGYIVTANPGGLTCTAVAPTTTCTITGLDNGTQYTFSVVATNNVGNSDPSSPSNAVTPGAAPSAPDYVQGTPGSRSVRIDWKAPTSGPAPVRYTVKVTPGGQTCTVDLGLHPSAALTCNFTGLTNGTPYTFTVTGTLANGNSTADSITVVPNPGTFKPSAPRQVVFHGAVNGTTTVTWKVPASNGGSTITKYVAFVNGSRVAKSCTVNMTANPTATLKCTFTGLKPKRFYSYRVMAVNGIGQALSLKTKRAIDINVQVVSFARGKTTLWSGLQRQAAITAKYIKRYKYTKVIVTGYTNPMGSKLARTSYTQARALTVANFLVKRLKALGVKNVQVSATGTGASLYRHPNAKQKKLNRSVSTLLTYK